MKEALESIEQNNADIRKFYCIEKFDIEYVSDTAIYSKVEKSTTDDKIRKYTNECKYYYFPLLLLR